MTPPLPPTNPISIPAALIIAADLLAGAALTSHAYSQSESDADDAVGPQEDASTLYAKPARRGKTRTFSESGGSQAIARQRNTFEQGAGGGGFATRSRRMSHGELRRTRGEGGGMES